MKKETMRKYSLLGMVLIGASAVTAAVLPKSEDKKTNDGNIAVTTNGGENTCVPGSADVCTVTANSVTPGVGSRTSAAGVQTSSITTAGDDGDKVVTLTEGGAAHTSAGPA